MSSDVGPKSPGCVVTWEDLPRIFASLAVYGACLGYGCGLHCLGASVPELADVVHKDTTAVGDVFTFRAVGFITGTVFSALYLETGLRLFSKQAYCAAAILLSGVATWLVASMAAPTAAAYWHLQLLFIMQGFGFGGVEAMSIVALSEMWGQRVQPWMQLKNLASGSGGVIGPVLVATLGFKEAFRCTALIGLTSLIGLIAEGVLSSSFCSSSVLSLEGYSAIQRLERVFSGSSTSGSGSGGIGGSGGAGAVQSLIELTESGEKSPLLRGKDSISSIDRSVDSHRHSARSALDDISESPLSHSHSHPISNTNINNNSASTHLLPPIHPSSRSTTANTLHPYPSHTYPTHGLVAAEIAELEEELLLIDAEKRLGIAAPLLEDVVQDVLADTDLSTRSRSGTGIGRSRSASRARSQSRASRYRSSTLDTAQSDGRMYTYGLNTPAGGDTAMEHGRGRSFSRETDDGHMDDAASAYLGLGALLTNPELLSGTRTRTLSYATPQIVEWVAEHQREAQEKIDGEGELAGKSSGGEHHPHSATGVSDALAAAGINLLPLSVRVVLAVFMYLLFGIYYSYSAWAGAYVMLEGIGTNYAVGAFFCGMYGTSITIGSTYSIPASVIFSNTSILRFQLMLLGVGCVVLLLPSSLVGSLYVSTAISSCALGLAVSCIFPLGMTLANDYGFTMDERSIVFLVMGGTMGEATMPVLIGSLMGRFGGRALPMCTFVVAVSMILCYLFVHTVLSYKQQQIQLQTMTRARALTLSMRASAVPNLDAIAEDEPEAIVEQGTIGSSLASDAASPAVVPAAAEHSPSRIPHLHHFHRSSSSEEGERGGAGGIGGAGASVENGIFVSGVGKTNIPLPKSSSKHH